MATKPANDRRIKECAAQHFGPWLVEPKWFTQAVQAVKAGTFKAETVRDDETGYRLYTRISGIARIAMAGQITKGDSSYGGCSSVRVRKAVRKAVNDDQVTAILLHVDSPGGTVAGTGDLADDVAAADKRKPVYTFIEDLGASAAYWVGSQARRVYANPTAMIGSIGTVAVVEDTSGMYEKNGIKVHVISTGPYKGAFTDGAPVTDDQLKDLRNDVEALNEHFLAGVSRGRNMNIDQVRELATGQIWLADEAKQLGLIDEVASLDAAVQAITHEVSRMNAEQFTAYAAEHKDSAEVKAIISQGFKAGTAAAHTAEVERMKAIVAACPGKPQLAIDQFVAGHDAEGAKATAGAIDAALASANAEKEALVKELDKLKALNGSVAPVAGPGGQQDAAGKKTMPSGLTPKAQAEWEWDNDPQAKATASKKEFFVAAREAELAGTHKTFTRAALEDAK